MVDGPTPSGLRGAPAPDPLETLDADLTIFALANAMELARQRDGRPCRALAWFREGLERCILIEPGPPGSASLSVTAHPPDPARAPGAGRRLREELPLEALARDLRPLLQEAMEAANALPGRNEG